MGKRVRPVRQMTDENFMKHLEHRHSESLKLTFTVEPGRNERRLHNREAWEAFHETIHRLDVDRYDDHYHSDGDA